MVMPDHRPHGYGNGRSRYNLVNQLRQVDLRLKQGWSGACLLCIALEQCQAYAIRDAINPVKDADHPTDDARVSVIISPSKERFVDRVCVVCPLCKMAEIMCEPVADEPLVRCVSGIDDVECLANPVVDLGVDVSLGVAEGSGYCSVGVARLSDEGLDRDGVDSACMLMRRNTVRQGAVCHGCGSNVLGRQTISPYSNGAILMRLPFNFASRFNSSAARFIRR